MEETTTVVTQENVAPGAVLSDKAKEIGDAISDFAAIFLWLFNKIKAFFESLGQ